MTLFTCGLHYRACGHPVGERGDYLSQKERKLREGPGRSPGVVRLPTEPPPSITSPPRDSNE
jgi:hypothetical protein